MIAPAIILAPSDQTAICDWPVNASRGLRKRINSVEELDKAREAATCALRAEQLHSQSATVGASNSRHVRRIQTRAHDLACTAVHLDDFAAIDFLLEMDTIEHTAVRQRESKSGAGTIAHLSTVGGVG